MTTLEIMTLLLSIKALRESGNSEKALEIIEEVLAEARTLPKSKPKEGE